MPPRLFLTGKRLVALRSSVLSRFLVVPRVIRGWEPLSTRGILALLLATLALWLHAIPESDLVAGVLGGATLGFIALVVPIAILLRLRLARRLVVNLHFDTREPISGREIGAGIILHGSGLPPFFSLTIERIFERRGPVSPRHVIFGAERTGTRQLIDSIRVPHRGCWRVHSVRCTVRDALGFSSLSWEVPVRSEIEASAPKVSIRPLPVVAGSARAGDQLEVSRDRIGDPFDIKPYDPSDGITRILWKTYARTGELVVRRPEPAAIPEGEVAVYLVARREDDLVAGALRSYTEYLEENMITILFGTDGMTQRPFLATENAAALLPVMNRVVWSEEVGTGRGFDRFLTGLTEAGRPVFQVIIFGPEEGSMAWYDEVATVAAKHMAKLSVALVPKSLEPSTAVQRRVAWNWSYARALPFRRGKRSIEGSIHAFISRVGGSGNELLICEGYES